MIKLPFVQFADYLQRIGDGRGLNPLLQNYWMVLHPPALFLGFASTVIPFAFALTGLMKRDYFTSWVKPALPWSVFSIMSLGAGILMGGAWAYEALSFGGFWAWDPVENSSLVPWILMVAATHAMLIYQAKRNSLLSSFLLVSLSFLMVLYSTFLTRSGILGESSVHAFTDMGMMGQLVFYMLFFIVLTTVLLLINHKLLISKRTEDRLSSREFWIFIGVMVLVASALHISFVTSLPVINKLFGTKMAPPHNAVEFFNSWQVPFAILICLLIAVAQFFKYRQSDFTLVFRKLLLSLIISVSLAGMLTWYIGFSKLHYILLLFTSLFAVIANTDYLLRILKRKWKFSGASVTHTGFALLLMGALISNGKQSIISKNRLQIDLGKDFPNNENIMLVKNDTLQMYKYYVTWTGVEKKGVHLYYNVDYLNFDKRTGKFSKVFSLQPLVQLNERMGNVAEPATKKFWNKDIYTHVTYANLEDVNNQNPDSNYTEMTDHNLHIGDTLTTSNSLVIFNGITNSPVSDHPLMKGSELAAAAILDIIDANRKHYRAEPLFIIRNNIIFSPEYKIEELGLKFSFTRIDPEKQQFVISIAERKNNKREFIILKAILFPGINLLWIGCLIMIAGAIISIIHRRRS